MPSLDWSKLKEIVADSLEQPPGMRAAFIEQACAGNAEMKTEALALVRAADDSTGVIDPRTDAWLGLGGPDLLGLGGQKIGRYRLQTLIAEGAMAAVYRAEQPALQRVVALKLFRTSLPLVDASKRFQRESQALARLKHPNIAQIYEAGLHRTDNAAADDAQALPFIAMELVDGPPLTQYADEHRVDRRGASG
ncbi:MAG: hypothetical protein QM770_08965 [Tepidisphaeraceae bacterium]